MDIVYKLCGSYGVDILRNLELKITPPNQFNDPFEFTPKLVCSDAARYARRLFRKKENLKKLYDECRSAGKFTGSFRDFRRIVDQKKPALIAEMDDALRESLPNTEKAHLNRVSELHAILCLSRRRDSILMWGHYCDQALGLVIGFDKSAAAFQQGKGLRPVTYVRKRVVFDANWKTGSPQMAAFEHEMVFSKNDDWSYENEERQLFSLASLTRKPLKNGNVGYFLPIPSTAVVSVTLSPRCSPQQEIEVRTILSDPRFSHVRPDRAVLNETEFSLSFMAVP
ncbi:MAG: DUF2971 domain-containing protein [Limisphaerales bacterium]